MAVLWANLVTVYMFSFFARTIGRSSLGGAAPPRTNALLAFAAGVTLVLVSGLRANIGDTYFYMRTFSTRDYTWDNLFMNDDFGFVALQILLKTITNDPQILVFVCALVTNVLIVWVLYRYAHMFDVSVYVYVTSGMYLVSMNGMRQFLAASILFAATKYVMEGKWRPYFAFVLLASIFHQSAIIFIPVYFIVRLRAWTWSTYLLLGITILFVVGYAQFMEVVFDALQNTQYGQYKEFSEGGANLVRVAVHAVPVVLAYLGRKRLRELSPESDIVVNMSLLGVVIMIISTQNWIFARFSIYFGLYSLILISWIVKLFVPQQRKLVYYAIVVCYGLYFFYEHEISLGIIYRSNFL
ncbi:EpsG family protein [Paenibacillus sp.]|uniref:EpsG family protein n=1 Tax=Paenibacillus sp. TaxID=58172 RepID=UPI00281224E3|nr:EpsG family protein [Paenibacillus sp.]